MTYYTIVSADRVEGNVPTLLFRNVEEKVELLDQQTFKTGTSGTQFCMICWP